jgi:serine/threonine-protein kinase TNNI3K
LRHPNIVEFFGVFWLQETFGFVFEYMPGGTLYDLLHGEEPQHYTEFEALRWASNIASGMAYLHSRSVMHGDLRSANVLLAHERDKLQCQVGGFSLMKSEMPTVTVNFRWTAPELLQTAATAAVPTEHSDAYSFAIVLWEIVTRELPYADMDEEHVQVCVAVFLEICFIKKIILRCQIVVPQGTRPLIPDSCVEGLSALFRSAWSMAPEDRPIMATLLIKIQELLASKVKPFAFLQSTVWLNFFII